MNKDELIHKLESIKVNVEGTLYNFEAAQLIEILKQKEKLELMLFMVVRNNKVLPTGIKLNKTQKEITDKTKETIKELEKITNFEQAKQLYNL